MQVITGIPCINLPEGQPACDHVEESVFPAETLGKHYFVTVPTAPTGDVVGHIVRLFGNVDATNLTYPPARPASCPTTLSAGSVVDCGTVTADFEITGDHEFGVGTFMLGASVVDPTVRPHPGRGRSLAERDGVGRAVPDLVRVPRARRLRRQLSSTSSSPQACAWRSTARRCWPRSPPIGAPASASRACSSGPDKDGAHVLTSSAPVGHPGDGLRLDTSYQYPGGLNLTLIAPPPTIIP